MGSPKPSRRELGEAMEVNRVDALELLMQRVLAER